MKKNLKEITYEELVKNLPSKIKELIDNVDVSVDYKYMEMLNNKIKQFGFELDYDLGCNVTFYKKEEGFFNFNRHELMTPEMHELISRFISELIFVKDYPIVNQLYGLYDGFYYWNNMNILEELYVKKLVSKMTYYSMKFVFSEIIKWEKHKISEEQVHRINMGLE